MMTSWKYTHTGIARVLTNWIMFRSMSRLVSVIQGSNAPPDYPSKDLVRVRTFRQVPLYGRHNSRD